MPVKDRGTNIQNNQKTRLGFVTRFRKVEWSNYGLLFAFIIMCIVYSILSPHFLTVNNITNVLRHAAVILCMACGQTFVLLSAGIDLSQGSIVSLVSVMTVDMILKHGLILGSLLGIGVGVLFGLINGIIIGKLRVQPFIATLGMLYIASGTALFYSGGAPIYGLEGAQKDTFFWFGGSYIGPIPVPVIFATIALLVCYLILNRTKFGRHVYALGGSEEVARLGGVNIARIKIAIYTLSAFFSAIGSYLLTSRVISGQPILGAGMLMMQSIGAVVIGGTSLFGGEGGVFRTLLGVLLISFIVNGLNLLAVSTFIQEIVIGAIIILSVMVSIFRKEA
jgi:ribose transport system permease protein